MAGHSKWAQIKRKKAVTDARRGKLWTQLLKEVTVAARLGGGDPAGNARLRTAISDARAANVPKDNLERAIKRGTGELEGGNIEELSYEGYAPGGVALLVETITDNRNRTVSEVRHLFSKHGGNLGENGCVSWMFEKRGFLAIPKETIDEEEFVELAVELGADDFSVGDAGYEIYVGPAVYPEAKERLESKGIPLSAHEVGQIPKNTVAVDAETAPKVLRLIEALEDNDDVQNVWANFEMDEAVMETVGDSA